VSPCRARSAAATPQRAAPAAQQRSDQEHVHHADDDVADDSADDAAHVAVAQRVAHRLLAEHALIEEPFLRQLHPGEDERHRHLVGQPFQVVADLDAGAVLEVDNVQVVDDDDAGLAADHAVLCQRPQPRGGGPDGVRGGRRTARIFWFSAFSVTPAVNGTHATGSR